jgi:outer membrane protein OmpA-like peptidoglycan-associated protein
MERLMGRARARLWVTRFGTVTALVAAGMAFAPAELGAQSAAQTATFGFTGRAQTWTVPAGITQATFDVAGGQGGKGGFDGGLGARVVATIPVTPGATFQINVGGKGLDRPPKVTSCVLVTNTGGWNGGGDGGNNGDCGSQGGGGASDVRVGGTDLNHRWIVAGGGGGGSGNLFCTGAGGGGNPIGGWGSCAGAGAGGDLDGNYGSKQPGQGAPGADPDGLSGPGGGGGGGWYGGGGGQPGLAGGGGSSYGPANAVYTGGTHSGDGGVTVTFGGAVPTITGIRPNAGSTGDTLTITGTNLSSADGPTEVAVGAAAQQTATCAGAPPATSCTVTVPAVAPSGAGNTYVTVGGQQNEQTDADFFVWVRPAAISAITPAAAPSGADVTIAGEGMVPGDMTFSFGSVVAPVKSCSEFDSCVVQVPAGLAVGAVPVVAQRAGAPSASAASTFTVVPSVVALTPPRGAAGSVVKVAGSGFSTAGGATAITFGGVAASAVGCDSTTSCTAVAPAGTGAVPVRVTVAGLESPDGPNDQFTYAAAEDRPPPPATPVAEVPFAAGGAQLDGDADAALQAALAAIQAATPDSPVLVEGHADNDGDDEYNADLSRQRAQAVADWLIEQGVLVERLHVIGRGETEPITSNDTADGRARNRRVEVAVEPPPA